MLPRSETEKEQREAKKSYQSIRIKYSLKRILLAIGSVASIIVGTYLIVYAASDWKYGSFPSFLLSISPAHAFTTGGLEDLVLIVIGIALWGLGAAGLYKSLTWKKGIHRKETT